MKKESKIIRLNSVINNETNKDSIEWDILNMAYQEFLKIDNFFPDEIKDSFTNNDDKMNDQ